MAWACTSVVDLLETPSALKPAPEFLMEGRKSAEAERIEGSLSEEVYLKTDFCL